MRHADRHMYIDATAKRKACSAGQVSQRHQSEIIKKARLNRALILILQQMQVLAAGALVVGIARRSACSRKSIDAMQHFS